MACCQSGNIQCHDCLVSCPISTESATYHQQGVSTLDATVSTLIDRGVAKSILTAYESGNRGNGGAVKPILSNHAWAKKSGL